MSGTDLRRLEADAGVRREYGATLNGRPIRVSPVTELRSGLLATGFPPGPDCQERNLT